MAIITISRGSLSGGAQLARILGQRLGARVISREVIVEAARTYGVAEEELAQGLSSPPGLWNRFTHQKQRYLLAIQASLAALVEEGNAVYHGHGGHLLLADLPGVIKLRLIAPLEMRVRAAMTEFGLSREEAALSIEEADARRIKWVRLLYGVDWADPALYDLVLNLGEIGLETACELATDLAGRREFRPTAESGQVRRDFTLATRLRAELALRSGFPEGGVTAEVRRGRLQLSGTHLEGHREEVLAFIRQVPGAAEALPEPEGGIDAPLMRSPAHEKTAADVMLPISGYPFIRQRSSIREAMVALSLSSVKLSDGHVIQPRYLLVHDEQEHLVGVVARRSLLRGLTPQLRALDRAREHIDALGLASGDLALPVSFRWISLFGPAAQTALDEPVEGVMEPIRCTVSPGDELSQVMMVMLHHQVDLVPVVQDRRPVGVIVMTELFDTIASHVLQGRPASNTP